MADLLRRFRPGPASAGRAPRVSVLIPLYNHAGFIGQAVESVLAQGDLVKEVLVVDDGSTDGSADAMEALLRRDGRVGFARQANQGAHATLNGLLQRSSGEMIAILNSDDAFLPGRLATLVDRLDAEPSADIALSGIAFLDGEGQAIGNAWYEGALAFHRQGAALDVALVNGNFAMTTSNFVFRRSVLDVVGGFAALRYVHDLDWLLRALALGRRVVLSEAALLQYRVHGGNTIAEDHARVRAEWAMVAAGYLTLLWDRAGAPAIDWEGAGAMGEVLRRHGLDRAVLGCMAYLRRDGARPLDRAALCADTAFKDVVRGWI